MSSLGVDDMYNASQLNLWDTSRSARKFMDANIGLFGQARSQLVDRAEYNPSCFEKFSGVRMSCVRCAVYTQIEEAVRAMEISSEA